MTPDTTTKLICAECRHENEAERIYCHNCGERLDRSVVLAKKKAEDPNETHRRLRKMLEGPSRTRQNFFNACKLLLFAAIAAAVVQMILPPEFPPAVKATTPLQLDLQLENASTKTAELNFSQQDINTYLAYRLAGKKKALNKPLLDFNRAAVVFKEGVCTIGWERSIFGYPLYSEESFRVNSNGGKMSVIKTGGWIGRLPIHPEIMKYGDYLFADVWSSLDRERRLLSKMSSVSFHDGGVTITSVGH
jgi:hypothetical protein